jgi:hypothetical protein
MISSGADMLPLDVSINTRLLLFNLAVTVATAVLFGIVPALRGTRVELTDALKDGRGPSSGSSRSPLGKALIVAQVVISLVLMVGAILFVRSLVNLNNVDTGFNREGVLRLQIDSNVTGLKSSDPRMIAMFQKIEQRVSALPGVKAASFASFLFNQGSWNTGVRVAGMNLNQNINIKHNVIGNDYFATMQIPLLAGRTFNTQETSTSRHVAIISERMAKDLFPPGINPIGHHYYTGFDPIPDTDVEVIGIVKDVKFGSLQEKPQYIDYIPNPHHPWGYGTLAVRYEGNLTAVSNAVQQTIHSVDRTLPISQHARCTGSPHHNQPAARRAALRLLRPPRRLSLLHRNLRLDVLHGRSTHERDRYPYRHRRLACQRSLAGHARDRDSGCHRRSRRNPHHLRRKPGRHKHALRSSRYRHSQPSWIRRRADPGLHHGWLSSGAPSGTSRSHGRASLRMTNTRKPC